MRIALCWCRTTIYIGLYLTSELCDSIYTRVWIWILYQPPLYWQQVAQCTPHLTELLEGHYQVSLDDDVMWKFGVLDPTIHFTTIIKRFRILTWVFYVRCWTACVVDVVMFCHYSPGQMSQIPGHPDTRILEAGDNYQNSTLI